MKKIVIAALFVIALFNVESVQAQKMVDGVRVIEPKKKLSPLSLSIFRTEKDYLKITFGQPFKRKREIFGGLVPYDQVWRTGANEATEITTIRDIKFAGKVLKAGTYSLFSIPGKTEWTIILNNELGQWGAYTYKPESDILRVKASSEKLDEIYEALTFKFTEAEKGATLNLIWDQTQVNIPIEFL